MSLFTTIRNMITSPLRVMAAVDPIRQKILTGHFQGGIAGYNARWHVATTIMAQDPVAKALGIKESTIFNVGRVVGVVVATYFTAGLALKVAAVAGEAGVTASGVYQTASAAMAVDKALAQKKAAADQKRRRMRRRRKR